MTADWIQVSRGNAPLIVSLPHTGTDLPPELADAFASLDRARYDADWHIDRLYAFAHQAFGATLVRTPISRSVIDVNRDPSGVSLYPGQTTTGLCPTETFAGEPLYHDDLAPDAAEIERRRQNWFDPYHDALSGEIARLRDQHPRIVLYEAHSIRSVVPRLFDGVLPQFNIGTDHGWTCDPALQSAVTTVCADSGLGHVVNGRFRGGWTTRHYGRPQEGVHAIQMELAMRGYLDEDQPWPPAWDPARAAPLQAILRDVLAACLTFAKA